MLEKKSLRQMFKKFALILKHTVVSHQIITLCVLSFLFNFFKHFKTTKDCTDNISAGVEVQIFYLFWHSYYLSFGIKKKKMLL